MTPEEKEIYDRGGLHGMSVTLSGMIGATIHCAAIDTVPMLAAVMGKCFMPYIPHLEKLDPNSMPRNIRKWVEILIDLARDVKEKQEQTREEGQSRIVMPHEDENG